MPLLELPALKFAQLWVKPKSLMDIPRPVAPLRKDNPFVATNDLFNRPRNPALDIQIPPSQPIDGEISEEISSRCPIFRPDFQVSLKNLARVMIQDEALDCFVIVKAVIPIGIC